MYINMYMLYIVFYVSLIASFYLDTQSGEVELEKSIAMYERGAALKAHCEARLREAQLKVDKIVEQADGALSAEPADLG